MLAIDDGLSLAGQHAGRGAIIMALQSIRCDHVRGVRCHGCSRNARAHAVAMAIDDDKIKIVTKFLRDTCLQSQPSGHHVIAAAAARCATVGLHVYESSHDEMVQMHVGNESEGILLVSGSSAEFSIQPMLPTVTDFDIMMHRSTMLAIQKDIHRQQSYQPSFAAPWWYIK